MRRILGTFVALVVAVSLVLIPVATVSADLGKCTGWDKVKWGIISESKVVVA